MVKIVIVDEKDNIIGYKERGTLDYSKDIYQVAALWITNSEGKVLLAKRAETKRQSPGKWGPAVSGTVDEGESYYSNIVKEAEEELGLECIKPEKGKKERSYGEYNHFTQWYFLKLDKPAGEFNFNKDEVVEVGWFSRDEILKKLRKIQMRFSKQ